MHHLLSVSQAYLQFLHLILVRAFILPPENASPLLQGNRRPPSLEPLVLVIPLSGQPHRRTESASCSRLAKAGVFSRDAFEIPAGLLLFVGFFFVLTILNEVEYSF